MPVREYALTIGFPQSLDERHHLLTHREVFGSGCLRR